VNAEAGSNLETYARRSRESFEELRRTALAAEEMARLAADMARYGDIGHGACLA